MEFRRTPGGARMAALAAVGSLSLLGLLSGCDDDEKDGSTDAFSSYEGIYAITDFRLTEGSCDEGVSSPETLTADYMVAFVQDVLGTELLTFATCADVAECEDIRQKASRNEAYGASRIVSLSTQVTEDEISGFLASSGSSFQTEGTCSGRTYTDYLLTRDSSGNLTLDAREKSLDDKPTDEEGYCVADPRAQEAEANDAPCTEREVFALTPVE